MSAVETLRRAAALMRERANAATPGPWFPWDGWGPTGDGLIGFARFGPVTGERVFVHDEQRDLFATKADVEHVASWSPPVALAVADWLDALAASHAATCPSPDCNEEPSLAAAVASARVFLGEDR